MGTSTIGIPDVSALPIESDASQYNLRNASVAFSPQPTPQPGAIGSTLTPDQSINELEQNRLQTLLNPPQYQPDFQQPQFQQPGPDPNDPLEQAKQVIVSHLLASQQANQQRGSRIKNILSNFFHGAGESMMLHAGLPTPEMQRALSRH